MHNNGVVMNYKGTSLPFFNRSSNDAEDT